MTSVIRIRRHPRWILLLALIAVFVAECGRSDVLTEDGRSIVVVRSDPVTHGSLQ